MDIKGTGDTSLIGEVNVSAVSLPGVKVDLNKLIDPSARGVDKVFNTLFGKRYAKQIRHIALSAAQTNADIKRIEEGIASYNPENKSLVERSEDLKSLITAVIQDEEITNILRCALFAADFIDEDSNSPMPTKDFINRWRNDAKQISNKQLQVIWGGILSSQINSPDTVSLRTLDIVKNMSPQEASLFYGASKNTLWGEFVASTEKLNVGVLNETGLMFAPLFSAGFGSGHNFPKKYFSINNSNVDCYYLETVQDIFLIPLTEITAPPNAPGWSLSSSGKELLRTIRPKNINYEKELYQRTLELILRSIGRAITPKGKSFSINGYHSRVADKLDFRKIVFSNFEDLQ